jgi:hypothetical protein
MAYKGKSIFFPPKHKGMAKAISIKSPAAFRKSIQKLKRRGYSLSEYRALNLAKTRAKMQLRRKYLSPEERRQMQEIERINIPKP